MHPTARRPSRGGLSAPLPGARGRLDPGWDPLLVVSASGVAERDCAFVTAGPPANAIRYVTRHEPES